MVTATRTRRLLQRVPPSSRVVIGMVILWLIVIMSRDVLRSHWWAYRLATVDDPAQRLVYFRRLCSLRDRAGPAVAGLLESDDSGVRSFAVGVLHHVSGETGFELLVATCLDPDEDVARLAIQGLIGRVDAGGVTALARLADGEDERRAMVATAALVGIGSPQAVDLLCDLVSTGPHAGVRVQAIEVIETLRATEAIPVLLAALDDETTFDGMTEGGIHAKRVLDAARPVREDAGLRAAGAEMVILERHVVWRCAGRALRSITGHTPVRTGASRDSRAALADGWRRWWSTEKSVPRDVAP